MTAMTPWSPRRTLVAGIGLILVVNIIALAGVAYNRSGEPESILRLTQRELRLPYGGWTRKENSGVSLNLSWRVPVAAPGDDTAYQDGYSGAVPAWLDRSKLAALGFDVSQPPNRPAINHQRQRSREVLLVLELDRQAYRQALESARVNATRQAGLRAANAGSQEFEQRAKAAKERLMREEGEESRLFVVDAGLDSERLRAQYPDRTHYMIVRGQIRPHFAGRANEQRLVGSITGIGARQINVPVDFQQVLKRSTPDRYSAANGSSPPFAAVVACGRRLEPWLMALSDDDAR